MIDSVTDTIAYIETHLHEKLNLAMVAEAMHYSKYHLHHMFTSTVGMTPHDYIRRRQLTEAAKRLVFSDQPILEAALTAGYESQQAFTDIFKSMYKLTPLAYREKETFYPLQLALTLHRTPSKPDAMVMKVAYARIEDIPDWMMLAALTIDGFPCFDEEKHKKRLIKYVEHRQALIMRDQKLLVGAAAWSGRTGSIDFLGVHPQYRRHGIAKALLNFILQNLSMGQTVSITTFREGDKADTGQREAYRRLGFAESELLTEFGYPTQRMVLQTAREETSHD